MSRKLLFLASLIVVLGLVGNSWAASIYWTDSNDLRTATLDGDMMDPCNWDPVPAAMPLGNKNMMQLAHDRYVLNPLGTGVCPVLDVDFGSVGELKIGASASAAGTTKLLVRTGGFMMVEEDYSTVASDRGDFLAGSSTGAPGTLIMTGGSLGYDNQFQIGKRAAGKVLMVSDDVNDPGGYPVLFGDASGSDGYIKFGGKDYGTGDAYMLIANGLMNANGISIYTAEGYIEIAGGTMELGDARSNSFPTMEAYVLDQYYNLDQMECYYGSGELQTVQDAPEAGWVTVWCDPRPPNCPGFPSPAKRAVADLLELGKLVWDGGATADSHKLYLSTIRSEVNEMNSTVLVYTGDVNEYTIQQGDLVIGENHYWRAVEYNDVDVACTGPIWFFTIGECVSVDDFESYTVSFPSGTSWTDDPDWETIIYLNQGTTYYDAHGGIKSMRINYLELDEDNYGDVFMNLGAGALKDWTLGGSASAASFWYQAPIETEKIQVRVNNNSFFDVGATLDGCWHEATASYVELGGGCNNVTQFTIRLGDGNYNGLTEGYDIYIDDLGICESRCVASRAMSADLDDDCDVDALDLSVLAGDWLIYDADRGPYNGDVCGDTTFAYDAARGSNVAVFDGNDDYIQLPGEAFANFNDKTLSLWAYYDTTPGVQGEPNAGNPFRAGSAFYRGYMEMLRPGHGEAIGEDYTIKWRMGYGPQADYEGLNFDNTWVHLAGVARVDCQGIRLELYVNGVYRDSDICPAHTNNRVYGGDPVTIGGVTVTSTGGGNGFCGKIDDVRLYSRALTSTEINNIYTGSPPASDLKLHYALNESPGAATAADAVSTHYFDIVSLANLYDAESTGSKAVNFKDYVILADQWGTSMVWP